MSDALINSIEDFLARGGEPDDRLWSPDGKPIYGHFSQREICAAYGEKWKEDFERKRAEADAKDDG